MKGADGCNVHIVGGAVSLNAVGGAATVHARVVTRCGRSASVRVCLGIT